MARYAIAMNLLQDEVQAARRFREIGATGRRYGVQLMVEPLVLSETKSLAGAQWLADAPEGSVLIDTLHSVRMGEDLAALPQRFVSSVPYVQVSDGFLEGDIDLVREAFIKRRLPGHGGFPLTEISQHFHKPHR